MKRVVLICAAALVALLACPAAGLAVDGVDYPFAVEIIYPENSIDKLGYYHVPGAPEESFVLQATLSNLTDQPIEIRAVPLNAYSGEGGIIYQSPADVDTQSYGLVDESFGLAGYIAAADSVTVLPGSSVTVDITVTVPDVDAGTVLGGIRFVVFSGTQEVQNPEVNSSTILIDEYLAIDTAIQIDLPGSAQPSLSAGVPRLTAQGIAIPVLNQAALIQKDISAVYQIRSAGGSVLLEGSAELPKMAPMTLLNLFEQWDEAWGEGEYTLHMQLSAGGETFECEQPFTIAPEVIAEAEEQQEGENGQPEDDSDAETASGAIDTATVQQLIIYVLVFGVPAVFIVIIFILIRARRKKRSAAKPSGLPGGGR